MFDVQFGLHDDVAIIKSIRYTKKYIKKVLLGLIALVMLLVAMSGAALALHFVIGIPLFVSILFAVGTVAVIAYCSVTYKDIKEFSLELGESGVCFKCRKTEISIYYRDLAICGLIRRAGSQSWSDLVMDNRVDESEQKCIFVFTADKEANLRKIVYHMRTSTGISHGHKKGVFCVSDYRGSPIFNKLFEAVEHYCLDYSTEIINKDRKELKKIKKQKREL